MTVLHKIVAGAGPEILWYGWLLVLNYAGARVGGCLAMAHISYSTVFRNEQVKVGVASHLFHHYGLAPV